jgi:hypothetical protein
MKASEKTLGQLLNSGDQFVIPIFQRYYTWTISNWEQLWDDITVLLESEQATRRHFLGSLVSVPEHHQPGQIAGYQVIDGQQRLTTLSIMLCALRDVVREAGDDQLPIEIQETYLIHRFKKQRERYKLFPRLRDRSDYLNLVDENQAGDRGIGQAYEYYRDATKRLLAGGTIEKVVSARELLTGIADRLDFVAITLEGENPYKIFKSLNSTGMDLGQEDLIRNEIFMRVPISEQDEFDEKQWRPLEEHFEVAGKLDGVAFVSFFRHALMRTGDYVGENEVYEQFQTACNIEPPPHPVKIVGDYRRLAALYDVVEGRIEHGNGEVTHALEMLRALNATTSYPLVLNLLERNAAGTLADADLAKMLCWLSSFVLRRFVCGDNSRAYGRWFCAVCRDLGDAPATAVRAFLNEKGWPSDPRFTDAFIKTPLYGSKYCDAVLGELELSAQAKSEPVSLDGCSVEHVMPQTINTDDDDGQAWIGALGDDWRAIHGIWLHTPGNLTLVGADYNSEMRNRRFLAKHPVLAASKVYINEYFAKLDPAEWAAAAIEARGKALAAIASTIWTSPDGPA